ncbi:MAG TPA: GLUG motif-containing protein, partial [Candidatus Kapabacteria bacterium]|nr:GLUG motif-containing protein [Candidatus Kapabacteria bacterium]
MTRIILLILCIIYANLHLTLSATYSGGDGSLITPYQIATTADLVTLSNTSSDWSKYFIQTANISFDTDSSTVDWDGDGDNSWDANDQLGFSPIGNNGTNFTGNYNGQNYTISNLYIKRESADYIGLFGYSAGTITHLGILNSFIKGRYYVGGVVGQNNNSISYCFNYGIISGSLGVGGITGYNYWSNISNSFSRGSVSGNGNSIGGLVGLNNSASISNCYSSAIVSGIGDGVGGLVGINSSGTVNYSYSVGKVISNVSTGGFIGKDNSGSYTFNFWDTQTSGQSSSAGAIGMTTDIMQIALTYISWDFTSTWQIQYAPPYYSYPYLQGFTYDTPGTDPAINPIPGLDDKAYSGGIGTSDIPYQIATTTDLIKLSNTSGDWSKYFIQTADIAFDANESTVDWDGDGTLEWLGDDQYGFSPIGNNSTNFTGSYNGQNYTISNLYINRTFFYYIGLFGQTDSGSTVSNIGLLDVYVSGSYYVGGLVGYNNNGIVSSSYSNGSVNASDSYVGGLVGWNVGTISSSYSTGSVSANGSRVGGLVGWNVGTISSSYSNGSVSASSSYVGGLVGENGGTVSSSYSTGSVSGTYEVGGLVGANSYGTVSGSYSTGSVSASGGNVGGLVGYNSASGSVSGCYSTGSVIASGSAIGGLVGSSGGTVSGCYWDTETSGRSTSAGGIGKTTIEMKTQATFSGWDFTNTGTWNIQDGSSYYSYPYL